MAENTAVEMIRVLVVSREMSLIRPLWSVGESNSWRIESATSGWEAMERVQSDVVPDLLLLDVPRGDSDTLHILRWLRRLRPELPVIVVCHPEDGAQRKEATRLGAEEVLVRPFSEDHLQSVISRHLGAHVRAVEPELSSENIESVGEDEFFLSASPAMQKIRAQAELLAQADVPVLILGEPGSGKATVARLIHQLSVRSGFNFLRVNCSDMPEALLEVELFGKPNVNGFGALGNGSSKNSASKLELAERGTLLLEEITEMPLPLQSRLLQVLQEKQLRRPGESQASDLDVRILASSSAKLDQALSEKKLREDLYYRLSAFTVHVPPLRRRREEIKFLLRYSMHKLARYYGLPAREFTEPVLDACASHSWPGNLRELETFVKRYLVAGDKELVLGADAEAVGNGTNRHNLKTSISLPTPRAGASKEAGGENLHSLKSLLQSVKSETERNAIAAALKKTGWNRKAAARLLKVSYRTLLYKIDQYHLTVSEPYASPFSSVRGGRSDSDRAS
jgi:two-component system, NtrC family, response regulator AtoC